MPLALVVLSGAALTGLAAWGSWRIEDQRLRDAIEQRVNTHTRALEHGIATGLHEVEILRGLFSVEEKVSDHQFRTYVDNIGVRWQGIITLGWIPAPAGAEEEIRLSHCAPASSCGSAFVAAITGSDALQAALGKAAAVKRTVVSAPLDLPRAAASKYKLVIVPVFRPNAAGGDGPPKGYALGVFVIGDLVELILGEQTVPSGLDLYFYERRGNDAEQLIYYHPTRTATGEHPPLSRTELMQSRHYLHRFPVADSVWTILTRPDPPSVTALRTFEPLIVLGSGLVITLLLASYITASLRRTARIEAIVEARTEELHATNILVNKAREEAEQANQAKTRFLAAASHDLRQPLQALNLFVNVLSSREHDADTRKIVEYIGESTIALENLLNALLDISKLDAGLVIPALTDVQVIDLFARLERQFAPLASAKGLRLEVKPKPLAIRTDPTLIENIMRNLVANAVRYTRKGQVALHCRTSGNKAVLIVEDTGPGIPEDLRGRVFQEFSRLGGTVEAGSDDAADGVGLGLAIVDRLARLLDHRVAIGSSAEHGSVFSVEVPLCAGRDNRGEPGRRAVTAKGDDARILVIDDEPGVLLALRKQLEDWGYSVGAAESLEQALTLVSPDDPPVDLVLADYRLGLGMTGDQAISALRDRIGYDVPGLLITGDTAPDRLRQAQSSGFRLLHKPVSPAVLNRAMVEVMAGKTGGD